LIGIAGGTGSGKTLVANNIISELGSERVVVICQDSYYKDLSNLPVEHRSRHNFDHPDSFDFDLLINDMRALLQGQTISPPIYDFVTHARKPNTEFIGPHAIIVLEGILTFDNPVLRDLMDIKLYVDTDPDVRFIRRLKRDTLERGRSLESIIRQYEESVRPMHLQFVEPSKRYADIIIPEGGYNKVAIDLVKTKIEALLRLR
jgi:uridine kinase